MSVCCKVLYFSAKLLGSLQLGLVLLLLLLLFYPFGTINITIDFNSSHSNTPHKLKKSTQIETFSRIHTETHAFDGQCDTQGWGAQLLFVYRFNFLAHIGWNKLDRMTNSDIQNEKEKKKLYTQNPLDALKRIKCIYILLD